MSFRSFQRSFRSHALIWAVLLCFALGTLAQAGHLHNAGSPRVHVQCELCVGFGGLMDAPESAPKQAGLFVAASPQSVVRNPVHVAPPARLFQARAPPSC